MNFITKLFKSRNSTTQLMLNVKVSNTIKKSLFFANFERDSNLFESFKTERTTQAVIERIDTLKRVHSSILQMQERSATYQNKKRKMMSQFKKKNKMYLLTTNLRTTRFSKKLDHIKIESFFIEKVRKSVNYKLQLSSNIKIHSMFHASFLKFVDFSTSVQIMFHYESKKKDEFEVEKILK